jgi:hypothetical protein
MILHITEKYEDLLSILKSCSFKLKYCGEYFGDKNKVISSAAHPMVSFSEFTEEDLATQKISYGDYAVALSKEWARRNGLNPVLYVEKHSQVAVGLAGLLKARQKRGKDEIPRKLRLPIMQVKCFIKHETGYNSHFHKDNFCFKDENEWRYVPTKKQIDGNYISLNYSTYDKNRDKFNSRLSKFPLKFSISDIKAVYVKTAQQQQEIMGHIKLPIEKVKLSMWERLT